MPTLGFTYFLTDHIAVEAILGATQHEIRAQGGATDCELRDSGAVQANINLVRHVETTDHMPDLQRLALHADLDQVFTIEWEVMANRRAAAGPEGELFAHAIALQQRIRNLVGRHRGAQARVPNGEATDLLGREQIPLQQLKILGMFFG